MIKINQNEKDEIQAWISMIKSPDQEAWQLVKNLILTSSFYKRNKDQLNDLYYICDNPEKSAYFINAVKYIDELRWELIEMLSELINQRHYAGYLIDGSEIEIKYETN